MTTIKFDSLKKRQRLERDNYSENLGLRIHRALSWLNKSEQCTDDLDAQFIFLWISFNSAYANEIHYQQRFSETDKLQHFLSRLCELDTDQNINNIIWNEFSGSIRVLLDNKYVFQPFWSHHNNVTDEETWQNDFQQAKNAANRAMEKKQTDKVLAIIFNRLYTLRNQLLHGGATWNSTTNRDQMRDATNILKILVPTMIEIMMNNSQVFWGEASYPVVE